MWVNKVYQTLQKDGVFYTIIYWLALPILFLVNIVGCGKEQFDPKPWVQYYNKPQLPSDLLPYDEYLEVMAHIYSQHSSRE